MTVLWGAATNKMNTTHSPLPWETNGHDICPVNTHGSSCAFGLRIATVYGITEDSKANAQFIVHACNSHADLLGALEALVGWAGFVVEDAQDLSGYELILKARQALALAKGETK